MINRVLLHLLTIIVLCEPLQSLFCIDFNNSIFNYPLLPNIVVGNNEIECLHFSDNQYLALKDSVVLELVRDKKKVSTDISFNCILNVVDNAEHIVEEYNILNNTYYKLLLENCYSLIGNKLLPYNNRTNVSIYLKRNLLTEDIPYLLPVRISVDGYENLVSSVCYIVFPVYSKSDDCIKVRFANSENFLEIYNYDTKSDRAILFCPGGGYSTLTQSDIEMAKDVFGKDKNTTLCILHYRLPNNNYNIPVKDAQDALDIIVANRNSWGNYDKIGVMGCSAGGHLASVMAVLEPSNIDFQVLLFPVITMEKGKANQGSLDSFLPNTPGQNLINMFSTYKQVNDKTPPALILYSKDDNVVIPQTNSIYYKEALLKHNIRVKTVEYISGGHAWNSWTNDKNNGFPKVVYDWLDSF